MSPYQIILNERADQLDPPRIADEAMKIDNALQRAAPGCAIWWTIVSRPFAGQAAQQQFIAKVEGVKFTSVKQYLDAAVAEVVAKVADWYFSGRLPNAGAHKKRKRRIE